MNKIKFFVLYDNFLTNERTLFDRFTRLTETQKKN